MQEWRAWEAQLRAWQRDLRMQCANVAASEWRRGELQREIEAAEREVGQLRDERKRLVEARRAIQRTIVEIALADASKDEPALQVPSPEDETNPLLARAVERVCANLPERPRRALYLRFGLGGDGQPRTYREVGEALGVTRSEAARLVKRAIGILRHPARSYLLRG
jgi:RNA polymerase sigma factor (sigma-70 family)